ncbi:PREDICTED: nuclear factor erythroid 2-related factor 1-like [Polistes canadensis]|uniref:nuclear factor erythroid 2-related factor 1-like n=1 Tax=Polistes canadensis TaxID=91411 RepID=UPI000718CB37|nr:PREDICTED: nuclear factor erythroid 2-related factor 1-like [Polistes canadensis]XP_014614459.1 PREDICTED: nuclear factor erythroid 2-related factor 1-like [Polistes canadensis]XP_014614460.1 PREDICTED: nuclear factor erythroid 2-related factor 1-like [Polistes canadensis]XP_014614461.1 PREDICTED: nuclear factor erythroid 2-related factor 1-like [Polistes canadensis]XP_014614462.1 PREDICTED: nuclear factor erythroid 2-related factor 1-like [Polistes canadensis]XP_014614463.1 PREDICTED: nucl
MLCLKKLYREELLQLALLLSLLRVDPESYLGFDIQAMGVGSLDLHNGSGWHTDAHTIVHRPMFVHPKNLDSVLLNYERDLFEDLNSLGRYNRMNSGSNDIHAYLLNVEDTGRNAATAGSSLPISTGTSSNMTSPDSSSSSQQPAEPIGAAELTQEDMDLIEVLWKQDVDLGFTLVEPTSTTSKKKVTTSCEKESEDEIEKLKALEAINATNQKDDPEGVEVKHQDDDDPWAGRNYTVDLETGEYILSSCNQNVGNNNEIEEEEEEELLREQSSFGLNHHPLAVFSDDSLGLTETLGLENDFTSELLSDSLLGSTVVEDFLGGNDLGLPDGFNLEEALQLVGLDEVKPDNEVFYKYIFQYFYFITSVPHLSFRIFDKKNKEQEKTEQRDYLFCFPRSQFDTS